LYRKASYGSELDQLIQLLSKLPGLGPRSARRAALQLIKRKDALMRPLSTALAEVAEHVNPCSICGNLDTADPCHICDSPRRDHATLCAVEDVADLWALERSGAYNGGYHVIGGSLSALDGIGPDDLNISSLIERVMSGDITEVIIATNATVDGQTTAHYITDRLKDYTVTVTRLAHGVPVGGELDYLDDGTLSAALKSRRIF